MKELQSQAALFEVTVPEYALIAQCRLENKMLKQMWDYIFLVRWEKKTPQTIIQNANFSDSLNNGRLLFMLIMLITRLIPSGHRLRSGRRQCGPTLTWRTWTWSARSLPRWPSSPLFVVAHPTQDVRGFDKTMRPWHAYQGLVIFVKNMSIYL